MYWTVVCAMEKGIIQQEEEYLLWRGDVRKWPGRPGKGDI